MCLSPRTELHQAAILVKQRKKNQDKYQEDQDKYPRQLQNGDSALQEMVVTFHLLALLNC